MKRDYSDIIDLSHHQSETHPHMSVNDRAAQFSPFAALTGYEEVIAETSRLTKERKGVASDKAEELAKRLSLLFEVSNLHPFVRVTYFQKDNRKSGGAYLVYEGEMKDIDEYERKMRFLSGISIPLDDIFEIDGDLFSETFD